ncbi:RNA-guided endonuclease TnpB family protein [Ktedonobacter racemifer]|uniref:Transposase, IS605 OrfB family n=1 Tax=Ktedonobacter racemifer DSM 44963 TaxID=485913 RepID=D6TSA5_KTERA|nr:RNA-guided endonuclease TnpB family protein [Ktedonobacter racemifer]EFH83306.1 transposase, IS605 OrfB family [Ktedonobacter racemifer DSM 44963]
MAKALKTLRQALHYPPQYADYFAANQLLFNRVVAFYVEVIQAHEGILSLKNKEALTTLARLTHATEKNPRPIVPLSDLAPDVPAMFRRAAINAALGSARAFFSSLNTWRARKERHEAKAGTTGKKKQPFRERPPVPPRTWNKSAPFYAGLWKERTSHSITLKVWTGSRWSWLKIGTLSRELPDGFEMGSPHLVRKGARWWLHIPIEKTFEAPANVREQLTTGEKRICAVDLNLDQHLAVCSVQTVDGTILATSFIGNGTAIAGCRKKLLGRIARNRSQTGILAEGEQDNVALWRKIRHLDEHIAHQVSARIVQFALKQHASILVFEHLGSLRPAKGRYSRRGNLKRAYWMKGRIFRYSKYKAWNAGGIITCRVNPRNTSRECHRCHGLVIRYQEGEPVEGYTPGAPLCLCPQCQMRGHADRNASLNIGQRLLKRMQDPLKEKPHACSRRATREPKGSGVGISQDAKRHQRPSLPVARRGDHANEHGTAQRGRRRMGAPLLDIASQLRMHFE